MVPLFKPTEAKTLIDCWITNDTLPAFDPHKPPPPKYENPIEEEAKRFL